MALIETKAIGSAIAENLAQRFPRGSAASMHWSGCPAGYGNHRAADIGFQGAKTRVGGRVADAVNIFVGGRTGPSANIGRLLLEQVPVDTLEQVVPGVLEKLKSGRDRPGHG